MKMKIYRVQEFVVKGKEIFVGLEDSKKTWKIAVRCERMVIHQVSMEAKYAVLIRYLRNKFPECTIHLIYEAGFKGFNLYDRLTEDGIDCVVIPPHMVTEPKVNRVKTDKRDANRLALILENHDFKDACHVPDKERREDRQISRTLIAMQKDIIRTRNRIRKLLDFHGIEVSFPDRWGRERIPCPQEALPSRALEDKPRCPSHPAGRALGTPDHRLRTALRKLCRKERYQKAFTIARSLPGIGWFTAIRLVLELGEDLSHFTTGRRSRASWGSPAASTPRERPNGKAASPAWVGVHPSDPHRELMDGDQEGPGPPCEVLPGMAFKRQQEEGDRRGGEGAHRPSPGMRALRHALRDRSGRIGTMIRRQEKGLDVCHAEQRRMTCASCDISRFSVC